MVIHEHRMIEKLIDDFDFILIYCVIFSMLNTEWLRD